MGQIVDWVEKCKLAEKIRWDLERPNFKWLKKKNEKGGFWHLAESQWAKCSNGRIQGKWTYTCARFSPRICGYRPDDRISGLFSSAISLSTRKSKYFIN
jgi:hypothetical protein